MEDSFRLQRCRRDLSEEQKLNMYAWIKSLIGKYISQNSNYKLKICAAYSKKRKKEMKMTFQ